MAAGFDQLLTGLIVSTSAVAAIAVITAMTAATSSAVALPLMIRRLFALIMECFRAFEVAAGPAYSLVLATP